MSYRVRRTTVRRTPLLPADCRMGIFKLIIGFSLEDEKVSVDDVVERIEALEDFVQSVEIAAFNKI